MKRTLKTVALVAVLLCTGCAANLRVKAVAPTMRRIMSRHDAYVRADATLSDLQRETQLRSSELLERVLKEAER